MKNDAERVDTVLDSMQLASGGNDLLKLMPGEVLDFIAPACVRERLPREMVLSEADQKADAVFFIEDGVASVVKPHPDNFRTEIALIGPETFVGFSVVLGDGRSPYRTFVQVECLTAIRVPVEVVAAASSRSAAWRDLLSRAAYTQLVQIAEGLVSAAWQHLDQRLARWLLMYRDRVRSDRLEVTHGFMAMMLGTQRTGVTETLHSLEGNGLITASRGVVLIRDPGGLRMLANDGYGVPEKEHSRLFGQSCRQDHLIDRRDLGSGSARSLA